MFPTTASHAKLDNSYHWMVPPSVSCCSNITLPVSAWFSPPQCLSQGAGSVGRQAIKVAASAVTTMALPHFTAKIKHLCAKMNQPPDRPGAVLSPTEEPPTVGHPAHTTPPSIGTTVTLVMVPASVKSLVPRWELPWQVANVNRCY